MVVNHRIQSFLMLKSTKIGRLKSLCVRPILYIRDITHFKMHARNLVPRAFLRGKESSGPVVFGQRLAGSRLKRDWLQLN